MAVMYELKNWCFPSDRLKWFHPTLEEHITKEPHLYQQQAWLETYEPMIRRRIHDRDNVMLPNSDFTPSMNIFHPFHLALLTGRGIPKLTMRPGNFLLSSFVRLRITFAPYAQIVTHGTNQWVSTHVTTKFVALYTLWCTRV
jgi:hypothetical protein